MRDKFPKHGLYNRVLTKNFPKMKNLKIGDYTVFAVMIVVAIAIVETWLFVNHA